MVSVNPANPGQGFYLFDPQAGMGLPGLTCQLPQPSTPSNRNCNSNGRNNTTTTTMTSCGDNTVSLEDGSKKVRKPYTITKSRESWTEQEHDKFLEALQLFNRDWKKIEAFVGSKTVIQIRSHAQKYFLKVQKSGTNEHVPPPRPKRKAAHPYPQKAPKNAAIVSHVAGPLQSSPSIEPGYTYRPDSSAVLRNPTNDSSLSSWSFSSVPPVNVLPPVVKDDAALAMPMIVQNVCYSSSNESPSQSWQTGNRVVQRDHKRPFRDAVMPDFSQAYSFIGSVLDPNSSNLLERLKQMDPINLETVLLLMRNLSANLKSPEFENHRRLLASYEANTEAMKSHGRHYNNIIASSSGSPIPAV